MLPMVVVGGGKRGTANGVEGSPSVGGSVGTGASASTTRGQNGGGRGRAGGADCSRCGGTCPI